MSDRIEFSVTTKKAALKRCGGFCEECGFEFTDHPKERPEYDHVTEAFLGGDASLENCSVKCQPCHRAKTRKRQPVLAKVRRADKERQNLRPKRRSRFPGSKDSDFKAKVGGGWERR